MDSLGPGSAVGEKAKNGMEKEKYLWRAERSRSRRWNARRSPFPPQNVTYISVLEYFSLHKELFIVRWRSVLEGVSVRVDCILVTWKFAWKILRLMETPAIRLHHAFKHLITATCTDYPTACGERKRDKAPRTFKNTCAVQHVTVAKTSFPFSVLLESSYIFLAFVFELFVDDYGKGN